MRSVLKFLVTVAILVGLYLVYRLGFGSAPGGPCSTTNDCAQLTNVQCLSDDTGSYCSQPCTSDTGCPQGWHCAAAHAPDGRTVTEAVCSRSSRAARLPSAEPTQSRHR